jgi:hypothetical protein
MRPRPELRLVPVSEIKPSPENDKIYHRVRRDDPATLSLADSIREHGLKEPLVLTQDNYVLSGHRRLAACEMAGVDSVLCRYEETVRGDGPEPIDPDAFLTLLAVYNKQRVKAFDEMVREEALSIDPEEAHRLLLEHRKEKARVKADVLTIRGFKHRAEITAAKKPFLDAISRVLDELWDYWPLTDRQIHYNLLNHPPLKHASKPESVYVNDVKSYKALCELLTRGRLTGAVPFDAISDPTRHVVSWKRFSSVAPFINGELNGLFKGYYRDLQRSQPNQIEIVGEKNTIESIIRPVAMEYGVPYTIGRGYSSLDPRKKMFDRFEASGKDNLVLLVVSDFDAEGEDIPHSFARSMRDDFEVVGIQHIKVALTHAQVQGAGLHPNRLKDSSSRAAHFRRLYGNDTYELEAIPPQVLQQYLRDAIRSVLDMAAFNAEIDREKQEAAQLTALRRRLSGIITEAMGEDAD